MTTGELVRCPRHFRTIKAGVSCPFPFICSIFAGVKFVAVFWWGGLDGVIRIFSCAVGTVQTKISEIWRPFSGKSLVFGKFVWHGRFRSMFLHRMGKFERFSDAPVFLACDKFGRKCAFLLIGFGLAYCLSSWWMMDGGEVVPEQQAGQKKTSRHQLMIAIVGLFLFVLC